MLILSFFLPQREPPLLFRFSLHFGKGMPLLFALFLLKLQRLLRLGADSGWAGQLLASRCRRFGLLRRSASPDPSERAGLNFRLPPFFSQNS